jgi:hypothetical protein
MRYNIPLENMPKFAAKIDKLAARAKKLGLVGPTVQRMGTHMQKHWDANGIYSSYVEIVEVDIFFGEEIKVQGWQFVAKIEHLPNGNIVKAFSEMNPMWRNAGPDCEHCNLNRRRSVTYVLTNGAEEIQVGSTCLKDFTGHADAEAIADYFSQIQEFTGSDEEYDPDRTYTSKNVKVETYLAHAAMSVRQSGYVSRKKAEYGEFVATADDALFLMTKKDSPSDADNKMAAAVIAYVKGLEPKNDFEYNVKVLVEAEYAHFNNVGYIAGALSAYLRNEADKRKGAGKEYVGTIKKREDFVLTLASERKIEGYYGMTYLYSFTDAAGNNVVWFASKDCELEVGTTYTIKGTVKKHEPYNNIPQTTLTRCKVQ